MKLSSQDLQHLASLSQLEINDEKNLINEVSNILNMANELNGLDTTKTEPLAHPLEVVQRLREDTITESDCSKALFDIEPASQDNVYLVPKVIENE